ncbi:MAG: Arc family DNA-binding protein [Gammaproteobacteria bacterium]|nr:Arc family DNA-binding protein [Gammaproteobacteria bacterium]
MSAVTVRNLPEDTHRALKLRAARHGRSTEAEIRAILEEATSAEKRIKVGSALAGFRKNLRDIEFDTQRDPTPPEPVEFE